jgi:hypothetical protein
MRTTDKVTFNALGWVPRSAVILVALLIVAVALIGISGALEISTATSSANVANTSHLPFGLEADPAEHELYRQIDAQCREETQSKTFPPLEDCR